MEFSRFRLSPLVLCLLLVVCERVQAAEDGQIGGSTSGQATISVTIDSSFKLLNSDIGSNRGAGGLQVRSNDLSFDVYLFDRKGRVELARAVDSNKLGTQYAANRAGEVLVVVPQ